MILNPEHICRCGAPKGRDSETCRACIEASPASRRGRPRLYSDERILEAVRSGADTPDKILAALGARSKSNLMTRLRELRAEGRVTIVERARRDGFTIRAREDAPCRSSR